MFLPSTKCRQALRISYTEDSGSGQTCGPSIYRRQSIELITPHQLLRCLWKGAIVKARYTSIHDWQYVKMWALSYADTANERPSLSVNWAPTSWWSCILSAYTWLTCKRTYVRLDTYHWTAMSGKLLLASCEAPDGWLHRFFLHIISYCRTSDRLQCMYWDGMLCNCNIPITQECWVNDPCESR